MSQGGKPLCKQAATTFLSSHDDQLYVNGLQAAATALRGQPKYDLHSLNDVPRPLLIAFRQVITASGVFSQGNGLLGIPTGVAAVARAAAYTLR